MRRNEMRVRSLLVLGIVLLFGSAAFAQDYAKVEIPLDYSYMRFNPENSHIISGLSLNGGGGGGAVYINHLLWIQRDFQGFCKFYKNLLFPSNPKKPRPPRCKRKGH